MAVFSEMTRTAPARPSLRAITGDLRRHRRLPLRIEGRYMRADHSEHACTTTDMSVGGARVVSDAAVETGERIVVYFEHLGGLEGIVARPCAAGFAIHFRVSEHKKEKLAAQIMWLVNRDAFPDELGRTHERVGAVGRRTTLQLDEGVVIDVELLDLSASGASLGTTARPALGEDVFIGKVRAVVRRHHDKGIGLQFLTVQSQDALRSQFP
jgi:PilZ domain